MSVLRALAWLLAVLLVAMPGAEPAFAGSQGSSVVLEGLLLPVDSFLAQEAAVRHWAITDQRVDDITLEVSGTTVTATFLVSQDHLLAYSRPQDVPFFKGLMEAGNALNGLSQSQRVVLTSYESTWESNLQNYIAYPHPINEELRATAKLSSSGTVIPGSVTVYELADAQGGWVAAAADLANFPTPAQQEANGQEAAREMLRSAATIDSSGVSPNYAYQNEWNASAALSYAEGHTGNNPSGNPPYCSSDLSVIQNPLPYAQGGNNYNTSTYPYVPQCNDCADFVSQVMHAGGIPYDYTNDWYPVTGTPTTPNWYVVQSLYTYMTQTADYWYAATSATVLPSGVAVEPNYGHTMIVDYNDGGQLEFDAHTNDRLEWGFGHGTDGYLNPGGNPWSGTLYYDVQYLVPVY